MNEIVSVVIVLIATAIVALGMWLLVCCEMRFQIKSYNKRHKGQYDEKTNPWVMSKRYQDWYVENFANIKISSNDEKKGCSNEK